MTNFLRHASRRALLFVAVAFVAVLAAGTAVAAGALSGSGTKPPAAPLDAAVHDALAAPQVKGVTARIRFTNKLITSAQLGSAGQSPVVAGATGRLWAAPDGRVRLELQGDRGDATLTSDGRTASLYDATSNTDYRYAIPQRSGKRDGHESTPTLADVQRAIGRVARQATLSGATPSNVAGRPAYTVRVTPRHGGQVGGAALAWDAATGTPLRVAVYAKGASAPVLDLTATDISYGPVDASVFAAHVPSGAKVVDVQPPSGKGGGTDHARVITFRGQRLVVFGQPAEPGFKPQTIETALGTVVRIRRGGVDYTVAGAVPKAVAEAAARTL